MNAPTLRRICAHSGSSFGSKTTHCVPRKSALLDEERQPPHRDVLPLRSQTVGAFGGARTPGDVACHREGAQRVDAQRVDAPVFAVGHLVDQFAHSHQRRILTGGRLPHAALRVGAGDDARHHAAGDKTGEAVLLKRVGHAHTRIVEGGVFVAQRGNEASRVVGVGLDGGRGRPTGARVDEQHGAACLAVGKRGGVNRRVGVAVRRNGWNAEQIEEVGVLQRKDAGFVGGDALHLASGGGDPILAAGQKDRRCTGAGIGHGCCAQVSGLGGEHSLDKARGGGRDRDIAEALAGDHIGAGAGAVHFLHGQVEERRIGGVARGMIHHDANAVAPCARIGGGHIQPTSGARSGDGVVGGHTIAGVDDAHEQRIAAAVEKEVLYGVAQPAADPQPAKDTLELRKTLHAHRLVDRAAQRTPHERGDRCGDADDGAHAAGHLLDVDARISECNRHGSFSFRQLRLGYHCFQIRADESGQRIQVNKVEAASADHVGEAAAPGRARAIGCAFFQPDSHNE
jgi:hypothetical protein